MSTNKGSFSTDMHGCIFNLFSVWYNFCNAFFSATACGLPRTTWQTATEHRWSVDHSLGNIVLRHAGCTKTSPCKQALSEQFPQSLYSFKNPAPLHLPQDIRGQLYGDLCFLPRINYTEQRPLEANSYSASNKITSFSCNPQVHYCVHKNPPMSQMNPVHYLTLFM
jgi:hypothetical protein